MSENGTELQTTIESRGAMRASRAGKSGSSARVDVSWFDDVIRLRDEDLFGEHLGDPCVVFLCRIFGLSEVTSVEINRVQSTADIRYDPGRWTLTALLNRLAAAIRGQSPPDASTLPASCLPQDLSRSARADQNSALWHDPHNLGRRPSYGLGGSGSAIR